MWKLCNSCDYEIDLEIYDDEELQSFGCPVCGGHDFDEEVTEGE